MPNSSQGFAQPPDVADSLCLVRDVPNPLMWRISVVILHKARKCKINYKFVLESKVQCTDNFRYQNEPCMLDNYSALRSKKHKIQSYNFYVRELVYCEDISDV